MSKQVEMPDEIEICDDCKMEFHKSEMIFQKNKKQFCKLCHSLQENSDKVI